MIITNDSSIMEKEFIKNCENLPIKINLIDGRNHLYHLHRDIEISFVLRGSFTYFVKNKKFKIAEKDLFLVNSYDIHTILSEKEDNLLLTFLIEPDFFKQFIPKLTDYNYNIDSLLNDHNNPFYLSITSNLANIIVSLIKLEPGYKLQILDSVIKIVLILYQNFKGEKRTEIWEESQKMKRISEILQYINDNFQKDLSLNIIAKEFFISPQYLSKSFKEILGIGFFDYLNKIRINKSINLLIGSKKSIIDIAGEFGFSDQKAYTRAFKKEFNMTPTEYRKLNKIDNVENTIKSINKEFYKSNINNSFKSLFDFLDKKEQDLEKLSYQREISNINLDIENLKGNPIYKYWTKITSVGRASLILRKEIQNQIKTAQKEIGYEYLRFHGIFSDDMMVYKEDSKGNPSFSWTYIDQVLDFLYEQKLRPFIELGFMPEQLASKHQYAPYLWRANVSFPKSISKWCMLVSEFIRHCLAKYGEEELEKWYFEIWNSPELTNIFWYESDEKFFEFFKETYFAIKKIFPPAKIGSPGVLPFNNYQWLEKFLDYCQKNSIKIDFISTHIYAYTDRRDEALPKQFLKLSNNLFMLADEDYLTNTIQNLRKKLDYYNINIPVFVTEWNLSPFTSDYNRDTCFLAVYIVRNILKNINNNLSALTFWNLSDIMEEGQTEDILFHGGLGLFTYNGIKKPAYNAFFLLNKLGDRMLYSGKDYIITKKKDSFQILLYNFVYFDELFKSGDRSLLSLRDRYSIFKAGVDKNFNIFLLVNTGIYKIKRYRLNRNSGSSFDAWISLGAPEEIDNDIYFFLKSKEKPDLSFSKEFVENQLYINEVVPIHGISLIEIEKIK